MSERIQKEIDDIDKEQQKIVARMLGIPLPKKRSFQEKMKMTARQSFASAIVGSSVVIALVVTNVLDIDDINDFKFFGIEEPFKQCSHEINVREANIRSGPGLGYDQVLRLPAGTRINILNYLGDANGGEKRWASISFLDQPDDGPYFVREDLLRELSPEGPKRCMLTRAP